MTRQIPTAVGALLGLWLALATAAAAQVSCDQWDTEAFFAGATAADVSRCLAAVADPDARDKFGWTPLHFAATYSETPAVVTLLVNVGADPNARSLIESTPLHLAAALSVTPAVVTALLNAGANPDARDEYGRTPLHVAAAYSKTPAVVTALLNAGADPGARTAAGKLPWDLIDDDSPLKGTPPYWRLNDARFE